MQRSIDIMIKYTSIVLALILIVHVGGTTFEQPKINEPLGSVITISNFADFNATAISGNGTSGTPFILELDLISSTGDDQLTISGTTAYFIIQNSNFSNGNRGIVLDNVTNGVINNSKIYDNTLGGLNLINSDYNNISHNSIYDNADYGFLLNDSSHNLIEWNNVYNNFTPYNLNINQLLSGSGGGGIDDPSEFNYYYNNTFTNNGDFGLYVLESAEITVKQNNISGSDYGVIMKNVNDSSILKNVIWDNDIGLLINGSNNIEIDDNTFSSNIIDMLVDGNEIIVTTTITPPIFLPTSLISTLSVSSTVSGTNFNSHLLIGGLILIPIIRKRRRI